MKCETEVRELLISNAIRLIAEGGFEKATTKELTYSGGDLPGVKMNEVYVYRLFGSKEGLYEATFECLDKEFSSIIKNGVRVIGEKQIPTKEDMYDFFIKAWEFVLKNELRCRCYVKYYHSQYFHGTSKENHKKLFLGLANEFSILFKDEADVVSIMHCVLTTFLDFAIRVYNGELEDEINRPHVFNVLYCIMMMYFKDSTKELLQ